MSPTVSAAVVTSRIEAELIAGFLRDHDFRAVVAADDAGGQEPELQLQGVRVLVDAADKPPRVGFWPTSITPARTRRVAVSARLTRAHSRPRIGVVTVGQSLAGIAVAVSDDRGQ